MGNLKQRIGQMPAMARVGVIACSLLAVGAVFMFFNLTDNNKFLNGQNNDGKVDLAINPATSDISKDQAGDEITTNSEEIKKVYKQDRENQLNEVSKGNTGGFVDTFSFDNDKKEEVEETEDLTGANEEIIPNNKFKEILAKRAEERRQKQEQEAVVSREISSNDQVVVVPVITQEEVDAFLQAELDGIDARSEKAIAISGINFNPESKESTVMVNSSTSDSANSASRINTNSSKSKSSGGKSVPMLTRMSEEGRIAKRVAARKETTFNAMQNMRDNASAELGVAPSSSSNSASTGSYASMVDPINLRSTNTAEHITAGTIFYSILEIGVNTDEISPVRATIIQEGPLKGAVLLGSPERRGEKAMITFNSMSIDGRDVSISAIALDLDTMRSALADDVDTHTFERYGKLITAAMIQGYSEALVNTSTTTNSDGSTNSVSERLPDTKDQLAYAIGKAGEELVPIFEGQFDTPPTVYVDSSKEIGIMVMSGFDL